MTLNTTPYLSSDREGPAAEARALEARIAHLEAEELRLRQRARGIQRFQYLLIQGRTNPAQFGRLERELEGQVWPALDRVRAQIAAAKGARR